MRILVIGCGHIGSSLAQNLILHGHQVAVVDQDPQSFKLLSPGFKGQTCQGSGFDHQVLMRAGVEHADGFAAVTSDDETNLLAVRMAKEEFQVPRVIARMNNASKADIDPNLGLISVNTIPWSVNRIEDLLLYSPFDLVFSIGSGEVDLIQVEPNWILIGKKAGELNIPGVAQIAAIQRDGKTFIPTVETILKKGDRIYISIMTASANHFKDIWMC